MTTHKIAYDMTLCRPACILIQVVLGGTVSAEQLARFPPGSWLTAPTPDMQLYAVTDADLAQAVKLTELKMKDRPSRRRRSAL